MRLIPRFAAVVVIAALVPAPAVAQWVEHKPHGAGFRVEMPAAPKVSQSDAPTAIGKIKMTMALVDRGGVAYIVSYNDYPPEAIKGKSFDDLLDGVRKAQVGNNSLRTDEQITIGEYPAHHIVIDTVQGYVSVTRIVLVRARLFQAIYVGPKGTEDSNDAKRFINSFQLVDR